MAALIGLGQWAPAMGSLSKVSPLLVGASYRAVHYFIPGDPEATWRAAREKWRRKPRQKTLPKSKMPPLTEDDAAWMAKFLQEDTPLPPTTQERLLADANTGRVTQRLSTLQHRLGSLAVLAEKGEETEGKLDLTKALKFDRRVLGVSGSVAKYRLKRFMGALPEELKTMDVVSLSLSQAAKKSVFAARNVTRLQSLLQPFGISLAEARATNLRLLQNRPHEVSKKLTHLQQLFGPERLKLILQKQLNVCTHPTQAVDHKLANLATSLGLPNKQAVIELAAKEPQLLTMKPESVNEKIDSLVQQTKLPMRAVRNLFVSWPKLLTRSAASLALRYHTLATALRAKGPSDITPQKLVLANPKVLTFPQKGMEDVAENAQQWLEKRAKIKAMNAKRQRAKQEVRMEGKEERQEGEGKMDGSEGGKEGGGREAEVNKSL